MALLAEAAVVEVTLRNAKHTAFESRNTTPAWYLLPLGFDYRSQSALSTAWERLPAKIRTPDRVVSQLISGFWAELLDSGGYSGKDPAHGFPLSGLYRAIRTCAYLGGGVVISHRKQTRQ